MILTVVQKRMVAIDAILLFHQSTVGFGHDPDCKKTIDQEPVTVDVDAQHRGGYD